MLLETQARWPVVKTRLHKPSSTCHTLNKSGIQYYCCLSYVLMTILTDTKEEKF